MEEKEIPSPYLNTLTEPSSVDKAFVEKLGEVCREYGYNHFFIAFAENMQDKRWKGFSVGLSETLVVYLELMSKAMRQTWDSLKGLGPKK